MAEPSETTQASRPPGDVESAELLAAVRALSAQVGGLQTELQTLRSQSTLPATGPERPGWDDGGAAVRRDSPAWVRSLDSPAARRPPFPRLALELGFLLVVATLAAVARLDAPLIVAVMVVAWLLVAAVEWAAARAARLESEAVAAVGLGGVLAEDPSWFAPPVERTVLEPVQGDEDTAERLPPASSA